MISKLSLVKSRLDETLFVTLKRKIELKNCSNREQYNLQINSLLDDNWIMIYNTFKTPEYVILIK